MDGMGMMRPGDVQDGVLESLTDAIRLLLKNAPEATFVLNEEGAIWMVNSEACQLTGCPEKELVGKPIWMVEGGFVTPEKLDILSQAGASVQYETVHALLGRRKMTLEVKLSLLWDGKEQPRGFLCTIRDISSYREAEEALKIWIEKQNEITRNREERIFDLKQEVNGLLEQMSQDRRYCA